MTEEEIIKQFEMHYKIEVGIFLYKRYYDYIHIVNFTESGITSHVIVYSGTCRKVKFQQKLVDSKLKEFSENKKYPSDDIYKSYIEPIFYQDFLKLNQL